MAKAKKGSKENALHADELEQLIKDEREYYIKEASINDGYLNYTYEILKGIGLGDKHNVKGANIVLSSMYTAFAKLRVHLACIDDVFKQSEIEIDDIDNFHNHEITDLFHIYGIKISGRENDSVIIQGTKYLTSGGGRIEIQSPKMILDNLSSYKWYNELKAAIDVIIKEVELYKNGNYEEPQADDVILKPKAKQLSIGDSITQKDKNDILDAEFERSEI